jgi:hypothetical protein
MATLSEKCELIWVFPLAPSSLARKSDDIFILPVREGEYFDVAAIRQICLYAPTIRLELFLTIAEARVYRKLTLFEAFVEQKLAKFRRRPRLSLRRYRKIEHDENPHEPISA